MPGRARIEKGLFRLRLSINGRSGGPSRERLPERGTGGGRLGVISARGFRLAPWSIKEPPEKTALLFLLFVGCFGFQITQIMRYNGVGMGRSLV